MIDDEKLRLKYRRQYVLSPVAIECPFLCRKKILDGIYVLYSHIDLLVTEYASGGIKLVLLGDIFDYISVNHTNSDILKEIIDPDYRVFLKKLSRYSGRYVIIYLVNNRIILTTDASGYRKIFYYEHYNRFFFASQPHLLSNILQLKPSENPNKEKFYSSNDFVRLNNSNIGNTTCYDEIHQVIPNHYFDTVSRTSIRFWPDDCIVPSTLEQIAQNAAMMIRGYMESIAFRYEVMLPVTAGKDSRILLSSTRQLKNRVYYYVNRMEYLNDSSPDLVVPSKLLHKLGLQFNVISVSPYVDEEFKRIYFENNPYASCYFLPLIYNYYINFPDRVNLPGNIASAGLEYFKYKPKSLTPLNLCKMYGLEKYEYAAEYYSEWLADSYNICKFFKIDPLHLFYWEERITNWGAQIQIDKDIAQEEFNLFNSRDLMIQILSASHRCISEPFYRVHRRIMGLLWHDVLKFPINPSLKINLMKILDVCQLLSLFYQFKYQFRFRKAIKT